MGRIGGHLGKNSKKKSPQGAQKETFVRRGRGARGAGSFLLQSAMSAVGCAERAGALLAASFVRAAGGGSLYCPGAFCSVIIANGAARCGAVFPAASGFTKYSFAFFFSFSLHSVVWDGAPSWSPTFCRWRTALNSVGLVHYSGSFRGLRPDQSRPCSGKAGTADSRQPMKEKLHILLYLLGNGEGATAMLRMGLQARAFSSFSLFYGASPKVLLASICSCPIIPPGVQRYLHRCELWLRDVMCSNAKV